jgi:hypothetical protein
MNQTQSNRKRKRKLSGPKRRFAQPVNEEPEPIDYSSPVSPPKILKVESIQSSDDEKTIETSRVPSFPETIASPTPLPGKILDHLSLRS